MSNIEKSINFEKDEHLIFEVRKHWFVISYQVTVAFFIALLPLIVHSVVSVLPITFESLGNTSILFFIAYAIWILLIWITMVVLWTDYYLDVWIITNKKIYSIEQKGLFRREISTMHLDRVQDVKSEVHGLVATMLDFGKLYVQTAGSEREFVIEDVASPNNARQKIHDALKVAGNNICEI